MGITLFTEKFKLELSKQKVTIQESNSRMNDKVSTKFTFPFTTPMDENFIHSIGDYISLENVGIENIIDCYAEVEGKISEAKLNLLDIFDTELSGQVDFGFEDVPSFDKKLSEFNYGKFQVSDIYTFAKDICGLRYPDTNFNFPRMYTTKYSPDQEIWDAFDGYYNDLKPDGSEMRRNYIDSDLNIFNVNIIHPCPHLLYLLSFGFADKGYKLEGEILTDPMLQDAWVFSGTQYFNTLSQARYGFIFTSMEFNRLDLENGPDDYAFYEKEIIIKKTGKYTLRGIVEFWKASKMWAEYVLVIDNQSVIWRKYDNSRGSILEKIPLDITINITKPDTKLTFRIYTQYHEDSWTHQISDLTLASDSLEDVEGVKEESNVVRNPNEIDLSRAVPDMTFGDLVNTIRSWFNYDIEISGKTVTMNRLDKDPENVKDWSMYQSVKPRRKLQQKRSFLLKFQDLDNDEKMNSMFYDNKGPLLNGKENSDTTTIEINGYPMPVSRAKENGYLTAAVKKDSTNTLALVFYNGLVAGQNNASYKSSCSFPELFGTNWLRWLRQRINGSAYEASFNVDIETFSQFSIKDYVYWHNNIHQFTSWTKEMISETEYKISVNTETII